MFSVTSCWEIKGYFGVCDIRLVSVKDSLLGEFSVSIEIEKDGVTKWWFSAV